MGNSDRPNSFYDSRTINTLGGASMALFVIATIIRFFLLDDKIGYKKLQIIVGQYQCEINAKVLFFVIVFGLALVLAVIRQFVSDAERLKKAEENPQKEDNLPKKVETSSEKNAEEKDSKEDKEKDMPPFRKRISEYFSWHHVIFSLRHTILIVINSFLIVASASGLSAVGGDSWFNSRTDKALLSKQEEKIKEQKKIIEQELSPRRKMADSLERKGIESILEPNYPAAIQYFGKCDSIYSSFHSASEIKNLLESQTGTDSKTQQQVVEKIINEYNYHLPEDLLDDLRKKRDELNANKM